MKGFRFLMAAIVSLGILVGVPYWALGALGPHGFWETIASIVVIFVYEGIFIPICLTLTLFFLADLRGKV